MITARSASADFSPFEADSEAARASSSFARRSWACASKSDTSPEEKATRYIGIVQRSLCRELHNAEAVQKGEHSRTGRDSGQERLQHDEIAKQHLADNHTGLENAEIYCPQP